MERRPGLYLIMAKTNKIVEEGVQTDYTSVIVSYSNGIDSTGALYWALQEFPKEKIFLLYCDTGFEYPENIRMFYKTAEFIGVRSVLLQHPKGFLGLLLEERFKWPDMKNRWCTAYLKTGVTDKWIRVSRELLGKKCLFVSGERRDESKGRAKLPEIEYHSTALWTNVYERPACSRKYEAVSESDRTIHRGRDQAGAYLKEGKKPGTAMGAVPGY